MVQSMSWLLLLVVSTLDGATCTAPYYSSFGSTYPYHSSVIPTVYSPSLLDTSYSAVGPSSVHHHHHHHHYYGKSPYSYGGSTSTSDGTLPTSLTTGQSTVFSSSWPAHSYSSTVFSGSKYPGSSSWFYPSLLTSYHQILKTTVDNSTTAEDGQVKVGNKTEHVFKNTFGKWPYAYQPFWIYQGSIQHFPAKKDGDTTTADNGDDKMEKDESQSSEESSATDDKEEEEDEEDNNKEATTASPEKAAKLKKRLNKSSNNKRNKKSTKDNNKKKKKTDKKK